MAIDEGEPSRSDLLPGIAVFRLRVGSPKATRFWPGVHVEVLIMRRCLLFVFVGLLALGASGCTAGPEMQFVPCQSGAECPKCKGQLTYRCPQCLGRGQMQCDGGCFRGVATCRHCSGTGKNNFDRTGQMSCLVCNGAAKGQCPKCNGGGFLMCGQCEGDGLVDCGTYVPVSRQSK